MIENGTVFLMDALHLIDVLSHVLHAGQGLAQVVLFLTGTEGQILQLLQKQRIFENALNWLDQIGFKGVRLLLVGVARGQKLLEGIIVSA